MPQGHTHLLVREAAEMLKNVARASCASALASSVLPFPGKGRAEQNRHLMAEKLRNGQRRLADAWCNQGGRRGRSCTKGQHPVPLSTHGTKHTWHRCSASFCVSSPLSTWRAVEQQAAGGGAQPLEQICSPCGQDDHL